MVVIGILLGAVCYLVNPFVGDAQRLDNVGYGLFAANLLLGLFLLPSPTLPNMWAYTHSLNGPVWSLLQEYLANLGYALFGHRLARVALGAVAGAAAMALLWMAIKHDTVAAGATWNDWWGAPIRLICSFSLGLLVHRMGWKIAWPGAFPLLSCVLLILFAIPMVGGWNGLFDWVCVVAVSPIILMLGAGERHPSRLAAFSGRLSYPLYMVHYPFVLLFAYWNGSAMPGPTLLWTMFAVTLAGGISVAWALLAWVDEPVRAWLSARADHSAPLVENLPVRDHALARHLEWCH